MVFEHLAFYQFRPLSDLDSLRSFLLDLGRQLNLRGKILLSQEGLNGAIAGTSIEVAEFQKQVASELHWNNLEYKSSPSQSLPFRRFLVKVKKEVIPGQGDPLHWTAPRLSPKEFKQWVEEGREFTLLDTRNDYEIEYGTFEGAEALGLRHFRDFLPALEKQKGRWDMQRPLVMFCTGGIRCEKASILASQVGFSTIYQLEGGILKYFEQQGGAYYRGSCFVFDERVALDSDLMEVNGSSSLTGAETGTETFKGAGA